MSHLLHVALEAGVRSFVAWTIGFLMGTVIVGNLRRLLHTIADRLDDRTPGGLGEIRRLLEDEA